ncbi:MAG: ATPase [Proteobacteria bacterium]|nr:ATPase [Pseudomonadota bacterium]
MNIEVIPNYSTLLQVANFVLLIIVMNVILYKPIRSIVAQRRERMQGMREEIGTSLDAAEQKRRTLEENLAEARVAGQSKKEELTREAEQAEKELIARINEEAARELGEMRGRVTAQVAEAKAKLEAEVEGFAQSISAKILGRALA